MDMDDENEIGGESEQGGENRIDDQCGCCSEGGAGARNDDDDVDGDSENRCTHFFLVGLMLSGSALTLLTIALPILESGLAYLNQQPVWAQYLALAALAMSIFFILRAAVVHFQLKASSCIIMFACLAYFGWCSLQEELIVPQGVPDIREITVKGDIALSGVYRLIDETGFGNRLAYQREGLDEEVTKELYLYHDYSKCYA